MRIRRIWIIGLGVATLMGQRITDRRTANVRGGSGDGKCTIEVQVDDTAEVEISGRNATIRTMNGAPASFRRFDCNQEMPGRPYEFRFKGVDGRGRQDLVRSPENGGRAVIRIEDRQGGSEGYTFDVTWRGGSGFGGGGYDRPGYGNDRPGNRPPPPGWNNGWGNGSGWGNGNAFNFDSAGRGGGTYRDRNGQTRQLRGARVSISGNGNVNVAFDGDRGRMNVNGRVTRRDGRRVWADVSGSGLNGTLEMEMGNHDMVRRLSLPAIDLNWTY